jgi:hypothetical protein
MAKRARALTLRAEFNERAERYELVASLVKRENDPARFSAPLRIQGWGGRLGSANPNRKAL